MPADADESSDGLKAPDGYLGVDHDVVYMLGQIVVVFGQIEYFADRMAQGFTINSSKDGLADTVKLIRYAAHWRMPPWATVTADDVVTWLERLPSLMDRRNAAFHASRARIIGTWRPIAVDLRSGGHRDDPPGEVKILLRELEAVSREGSRLSGRVAMNVFAAIRAPELAVGLPIPPEQVEQVVSQYATDLRVAMQGKRLWKNRARLLGNAPGAPSSS